VRCTLGAVLDAFRPPLAPSANDRSASHSANSTVNTSDGPGTADSHCSVDGSHLMTFFRQRSTALQHHTLALLGRVLHVDPTAIHTMRGAALWELAFGPAFFFFGQVWQLMPLKVKFERLHPWIMQSIS
jgi:hypothetical protein